MSWILAIGIIVGLLGILGCGAAEAPTPQQPATPLPPAPPQPAPAVATVAPQQPAAPAQPAPAPTAAQVFQPISPPVQPAVTPVRVREAPAQTTTIKQGGTIRWAPQATIANLDPVRQTSFVTFSLVRHFYDYPVGYNAKREAGLQMLERWELTSDSREYTFKLREGLAFHNGNPVTSEDVMASIERWKTTPGTPGTLWDLAGKPTMTMVDARTFKFVTGDVFGLWVPFWASSPTFVMPREVVSRLQVQDINTNYTGSGPFKFVSWVPGNRAIIERNAAYKPRSDAPDGDAGARIAYVDKIEYMEVPDAATKLAALQTRHVDFAEGLPNDFYKTLVDSPSLDVVVIPQWARPGLATNKLNPPLNNPKSRLAILAATDPEKYMRAAYGGPDLWELGPCLWACTAQWGSQVGAEAYKKQVDMEKARRLWKEAVDETGFKGKMVLLTNTDYADFYAAALITKEILESLGAEVDFVVTDWATVISRKEANLRKPPEEGGWHFYHTWQGPLDPITDAAINQAWNGGYHNAKVVELRNKFIRAKSVEEAKAIVDEIQRVFWFEDPAIIPYGWFKFVVAMQDDVEGYRPHNRMMMEGVWLNR